MRCCIRLTPRSWLHAMTELGSCWTISAGYFETLYSDLESAVGSTRTIFGEPQQRIYIYQECP